MQPSGGFRMSGRGCIVEGMEITKVHKTEKVQLSFTLEVEGAPAMEVSGLTLNKDRTFKVQPRSILGTWTSDTRPEMRVITIRGLLGGEAGHPVSREFALHLPPNGWKPVWELAPEWVFEALKKAGVEY